MKKKTALALLLPLLLTTSCSSSQIKGKNFSLVTYSLTNKTEIDQDTLDGYSGLFDAETVSDTVVAEYILDSYNFNKGTKNYVLNFSSSVAVSSSYYENKKYENYSFNYSKVDDMTETSLCDYIFLSSDSVKLVREQNELQEDGTYKTTDLPYVIKAGDWSSYETSYQIELQDTSITYKKVNVNGKEGNYLETVFNISLYRAEDGMNGEWVKDGEYNFTYYWSK